MTMQAAGTIAHTIGVGYNPAFVTGALPAPAMATYVEAGVRAFYQLERVREQLPNVSEFSLHLARVPSSEAAPVQAEFVRRLVDFMTPAISSVGMHLCGPLRANMGRFGLGSPFVADAASCQRARQLIERLRSETGRRVVIENANYYDADLRSAAAVFAAQSELARATDSGIILDLAHLIMDAHNLGVDAHYLLGMVDIDRIDVIHLSGISQAPDGAMHDGHQHPVHDAVWALLEVVLAQAQRPIRLVIEHTEASWPGAPELFSADFERLRARLQGGAQRATPRHRVSLDRVAIGYLARLVFPPEMPSLVSALGSERFQRLVRDWGEGYLANASTAERLAFCTPETRILYGDGLHDLRADFLAYVRARATA